MKFEVPIEGKHVGCLHCGGNHSILPMDKLLAAGFGSVTVSRNGEVIYDDNERIDAWIARDAEEEAKKDPDQDWRIHFFMPLREAKYQRQGDEHWVLYEEGMGFA